MVDFWGFVYHFSFRQVFFDVYETQSQLAQCDVQSRD